MRGLESRRKFPNRQHEKGIVVPADPPGQAVSTLRLGENESRIRAPRQQFPEIRGQGLRAYPRTRRPPVRSRWTLRVPSEAASFHQTTGNAIADVLPRFARGFT